MSSLIATATDSAMRSRRATRPWSSAIWTSMLGSFDRSAIGINLKGNMENK